MFARSLCADVEFSPEDTSRTELKFLAEVVEAAIDAGATTINVPIPSTIRYQKSLFSRASQTHT